ncbi:MAG: transposase domain-containing protein [Candidatus Thiodiazotropha sp.]
MKSTKANSLEPKRYLNELFERYPLAVTGEQRAALLPWLLKLAISQVGRGSCCLPNAYIAKEEMVR